MRLPIGPCSEPLGLYVHFYEAACHVETCESETRCVCVCVTRRLAATGGGKQADLYIFDQPGGTGRSGEDKGRKWKGRCLSLRRKYEDVCSSVHPLPQPEARCPVCQRC